MDKNTASNAASSTEKTRTVTVVMHPCRRQWAELQATDQADVRFCFDCCQSIVHVRTTKGVMQAAAAGECVYIEPNHPLGPFLGDVGYPLPELTGSLTWED